MTASSATKDPLQLLMDCTSSFCSWIKNDVASQSDGDSNPTLLMPELKKNQHESLTPSTNLKVAFLIAIPLIGILFLLYCSKYFNYVEQPRIYTYSGDTVDTCDDLERRESSFDDDDEEYIDKDSLEGTIEVQKLRARDIPRVPIENSGTEKMVVEDNKTCGEDRDTCDLSQIEKQDDHSV